MQSSHFVPGLRRPSRQVTADRIVSIRAVRSVAVIVCLGVFLAGCAGGGNTESFRKAKNLNVGGAGKRVLLMPTDVELSLLTAGGVEEPKAEWTQKAKQLIAPALRDNLKKDDLRIVEYGRRGNTELAAQHVQLAKLHTTVGLTILDHEYRRGFKLPSKKGAFDWTLGRDVALLRKKYKADYGLFIFLRDSYASGGRKALMVVSALFGGAQGGTQIGFATLVDLRSGNIVWFNILARESGDLRTEKGAKETMSALLQGFPK
jgi:hypothetical protein